MTFLERYGPLIGRTLLVLIFFMSGLNKIGNWEGTAGYMASKDMPMIPLFLVGAMVLEIGGSISVILGYRARLGALALIVFILPATFIFHDFWTLEGMQAQLQMGIFMKNFAMMGGLLFIAALGAGPVSLDARRQSTGL